MPILHYRHDHRPTRHLSLRPLAFGLTAGTILAGSAFALPAAAAGDVAPGTSVSATTAAVPQSGSVSLSPVKISAAVSAGNDVIPVTVSNGEASAVRVTIATSGLSEQPDGVPLFTGPPPAPTSVPEAEFTLAPGKQQIVPVTISVTNSTAGVYEGILATVSPVGASGGVASRSRLASIVELTGPASAAPGATIGPIATAAGQAQRLTITAPVRNTGNVLIAPTGNATIIAGNVPVATIPLTGGRIVPGASFDFTGDWSETTPLRGRVRIRVALSDPTASATSTLTFSDGAPPTALARIDTATVRSSGHDVALSLRISDTGTSRLSGLTVATTTFTGLRNRALAGGRLADLVPGHSGSLTQRFALPAGDHVVSISLLEHGTILDRRTVTVHIASGPSVTVLIEIIAIAVALLVAAWLVAVRVRARLLRKGSAVR